MGPPTSRYVANGSYFSRLAAGPVGGGVLISVARYSAINYKEFEGASPQKSPQW